MATPLIADQNDPLFVAHAILAQLGGEQFLARSGCHSLLGCAGYTAQDPNPWLRLELGPAGADRWQRMLVTLMPNDLYEVDFYTPRTFGPRSLEEKCGLLHRSHVYAEDLRAVFTAATGCDLATGRKGGPAQ